MSDVTLANKALSVLIEKTFYPRRCFQLIINSENNHESTHPVKVESLDEQYLVLSLPESTGQLELFKPGANVMMICKNDDGQHDFIFNSQIIEIIPNAIPRLYIKRPVQIFSPRRQFFRLDVNLPFTCFKGQQKLSGEITNLSAGGMSGIINSANYIEPGAALVCQITLPNAAKPVMLVGKVARNQEINGQQEIALQFQMVNKNDEDLITNFLFQNQRRQINENRKKTPVNITESRPARKYLAG